jgi:hypothetical protein
MRKYVVWLFVLGPVIATACAVSPSGDVTVIPIVETTLNTIFSNLGAIIFALLAYAITGGHTP